MKPSDRVLYVVEMFLESTSHDIAHPSLLLKYNQVTRGAHPVACDIELVMGEAVLPEINRCLLQGLSLSLVDHHRKTDFYGEL